MALVRETVSHRRQEDIGCVSVLVKIEEKYIYLMTPGQDYCCRSKDL